MTAQLQPAQEVRDQLAALRVSTGDDEQPMEAETWNSLDTHNRVIVILNGQTRYVAFIGGHWSRVTLVDNGR